MILNREEVCEILRTRIDESDVPDGIEWNEVVEAASRYIEIDSYDWLDDNIRYFIGDMQDEKWLRNKVEEIRCQTNT